MSSKRVRRHHVVSRFYLEGFANDNSRLIKTLLPGDQSYPIALIDATVNKDYYSVELEDGTLSDYFEKAFSDVEGPASIALRGLLSTPAVFPEGDERAALSEWIALQYLRSPAIRNQGNEMESQFAKMVIGVVGTAGLRNFIEEREGAPISDARLQAEWDDLIKPGGPTIRPRAEKHIADITSLLPTMTELIYKSPWMIPAFSRKTLVTSDHPVFLVRDPTTPAWQGVGITNAYAYGLALSRSRGMLVLTGEAEDNPDGVIPGTAARARTINMQTIQNAREAIFHHPDDKPVAWFEGGLPEPRASEISSGGDGLIMPDAVGYPAPARGVTDDTEDADSFSLTDLNWPIPNRVFEWHEPAEANDGR